MGSTKWQRQRKAAREAGIAHADGGEDRLAEFAALGDDCKDAYESAFADHQRNREQQEARASHPLRQIAREANDIYMQTENRDVRELADLIERMADYIVQKEEQG